MTEDAAPTAPTEGKPKTFGERFTDLCTENAEVVAVYVRQNKDGSIMIGGHKGLAGVVKDAMALFVQAAKQGEKQRPRILNPRHLPGYGPETPFTK